jgi:hypothetical protein
MAESNNNLPVPAGPPANFLFYTTEDGQAHIRVLVDGQTCWMTQKLMAELFETTVANANIHIHNIFEEGELDEKAAIKEYLITASDGKQYRVSHYNLDVILAVGYRVRSVRGTQFRRWATRTLREYLVKGFVLDDARLKACEQTFGQDYFDELLERIREIRASERRFYQKITDIYAQCSVDYDPKAPVTREFFAAVQNKLEWAVTHRTAAEIIHNRADAAKPNMGLATWKNAPAGKIRRADVAVAKNYLTEDEIRELNRVVTMYLDHAEDQARRRQPTTMAQWAAKLDAFLEFSDRQILKDAGRIEKSVADRLALEQFDQYQQARRRLEATEPTSDFDRFVEDAKRVAKPPMDDGGRS